MHSMQDECRRVSRHPRVHGVWMLKKTARTVKSERFCVALPNQRTGKAYIRPPLLHWLFKARGRVSGDLGPTLRSKISP